MNPEAQRIAIAEACGHEIAYGEIVTIEPRDDGSPTIVDHRPIPDYLNDLNAMHEAVKSLNAFQWELYREELAEVCTPLAICSGKEQQYKFAMEATAAQRAEAFLRAIGKLEDDK